MIIQVIFYASISNRFLGPMRKLNSKINSECIIEVNRSMKTFRENLFDKEFPTSRKNFYRSWFRISGVSFPSFYQR